MPAHQDGGLLSNLIRDNQLFVTSLSKLYWAGLLSDVTGFLNSANTI